MFQKGWKREELLIALKIYCELEFGQFHSSHPRIIDVAHALGRTPSALAMKLCNFASLDPAMAGKGLKGASKGDQAIIQSFLEEPKIIIHESELAYAKIVSHAAFEGLYDSQNQASFDFEPHGNTESTTTIQTRTKQNFFRKAVISSYKFNCAICGINIEELLVASHIIPWAKNENLRLLPNNGIALCATHDKAFDRGFFSLEEDYSVILSSEMENFKENKFVDLLFTRFSEKKINLPFRFIPDQECIAWHRSHIFRG